jgi:hypothetical protein
MLDWLAGFCNSCADYSIQSMISSKVPSTGRQYFCQETINNSVENIDFTRVQNLFFFHPLRNVPLLPRVWIPGPCRRGPSTKFVALPSTKKKCANSSNCLSRFLASILRNPAFANLDLVDGCKTALNKSPVSTNLPFTLSYTLFIHESQKKGRTIVLPF